MNKLKIIGQFLSFLVQTRKWWLLPVVFLLLIIGAVLIFAKGSALAPFIYTLF